MKSKKSEKKTYAEPRTLVAEVDGVKYTRRTSCNYRYFWVCNAILLMTEAQALERLAGLGLRVEVEAYRG